MSSVNVALPPMAKAEEIYERAMPCHGRPLAMPETLHDTCLSRERVAAFSSSVRNRPIGLVLRIPTLAGVRVQLSHPAPRTPQ